MNKPGHGGVAVFREGVFHHGSESVHLLCHGDDLPADGVVRILGVDQGNKIWCYVHAEQALRLQSLAFALGEM